MRKTEPKPPTSEHLARQIWLNYYNDYLLAHGAISREAWRRMRLAIGRDNGISGQRKRDGAV